MSGHAQIANKYGRFQLSLMLVDTCADSLSRGVGAWPLRGRERAELRVRSQRLDPVEVEKVRNIMYRLELNFSSTAELATGILLLVVIVATLFV